MLPIFIASKSSKNGKHFFVSFLAYPLPLSSLIHCLFPRLSTVPFLAYPQTVDKTFLLLILNTTSIQERTRNFLVEELD